ncbi:MAG: hypothetical protein ABEI77_09750 [Halorientalis sp.]
MVSKRRETPVTPRNGVFTCLADGERRDVLRVLLGHETAVSTDTLTARLEASNALNPTPDSDSNTRSVASELFHRHLPTLAAAGLVTWDREAETVTLTDHPAIEDTRFRLLLGVECDGLDTCLRTLGNERRRVICTVLREQTGPVSRIDLAKTVCRYETETDSPSPDRIETLRTQLYHQHLPALAARELVDYDADADRVAYTAHPALETIFEIIYEPKTGVVDAYGGFLHGLEAAYSNLRSRTERERSWPHNWRDVSNV